MRLPAPSLGVAQALEDADYNVAVDMLTESAFDPTVDRSKKVHTLFLWAPIGLHLRTPPPRGWCSGVYFSAARSPAGPDAGDAAVRGTGHRPERLPGVPCV